jgi:tape measure domain-containing protein
VSDEQARFGLELIDKVSGNAERIIGGLEGATGALEKLSGTSSSSAAGMTKVGRAVEYMTFALRGIQIAHGVVELSKALGGFGALKNGIRRSGQELRRFGQWAAVGLKRIAPYVAGGAGLYGLGKIASGVAVPALGATAVGIGAISLAATGGALAVGYLGLKLAGLAYEGLRATAGFATFGQNSRMAFNALAKHGASGAKLFEHAKNLAVEYGQDVHGTVDGFKSLLAGGFNPKLATDILKMGGDLRFIGASAEQVKGAVRAINQIKAAGTLQGDELNQLSEAMIGKESVYDAIAKKLGKTRKEVIALKEAGKLDSGTAITGILDAVMATTGETELGQRGKEWADHSIDGMTSRLKAKGENVMQALGDRLAPSLQRLAGGALERVEGFLASPKSDQLIQQIGNTFDVMGDVAMKALPLVGKFLDSFGTRGADILMGVNAAMDAFGGAGGMSGAEAAVMLGRGLADAVFWGGVLIGTIGGIVGALGSVLYYATVGFPELVGKFASLGVDIAKGLANGIKSAVMYPINAMREMGLSAVASLNSVMRFGSPSHTMFDRGDDTGMGYALGITSTAGAVAAASRNMALGAVSAADVAARAPVAGAVSASPSMGAIDVAGMARGGVIRFQLVQHIDGSGLDANEVAQISARESRRAVESFFGQLDNEA